MRYLSRSWRHSITRHNSTFAMTPERADAYRRVIRTLNELGPSKLLSGEQDRIRHAVDNLIFSRDLMEDTAAREALQDMERLCSALVESGRWELAGATRLASEISQCGPPPPPELQAA
jgi:hypothetical protein